MLSWASFSRRLRRVIPDFRVKNKTLIQLFDWLRLVFREFIHNRCDLRAAVLSFATVLSLVPIVAVIFTFFDLFGGAEWLTNRIKPYLLSTFAIGVGDKALVTLDRLLVKVPLGALGGLGFFFLVLSGLTLLNSLEEAFNDIWKVTQRRSWFARLRNFWVAVTLVPLLILASLVATSSLHWNQTFKALLTPGVYTLISSWVVPLFLEWLGFLLLFLLVPNVRLRWSSAAWGALLGSVLWEVAKRLYFLYTTLIVTNNLLYGALISIPLFFVWLNITYLILLFALQATYVTQHFGELRQFRGKSTEALSWESIALNLMLDAAGRQVSGQPALRLNAAAARFEIRAPEFRRLINKLVKSRLIAKPDSDNDNLHLARDSSQITLGQIFDLLGEIPMAGLSSDTQARLLDLQTQRSAGYQTITLKDLV